MGVIYISIPTYNKYKNTLQAIPFQSKEYSSSFFIHVTLIHLFYFSCIIVFSFYIINPCDWPKRLLYTSYNTRLNFQLHFFQHILFNFFINFGEVQSTLIPSNGLSTHCLFNIIHTSSLPFFSLSVA